MPWVVQGRTIFVNSPDRRTAASGTALLGDFRMKGVELGSARLVVFVGAFLVALTDNPSARAGTVYTERAAFEAATPGGANYNFDSLSTINGFMYYGNSVTTNGVTFTTANTASLFAFGRDYLGGDFAFGTANVVLQHNNNTSNITAILPPGTHAFGVDLGGGDLNGQDF